MPSFVLTTARQTLRELGPEDAEALFAMNADPEVMRYVPDSAHGSVEETRAFLVSYQDVYRTDGFARWAAIETATGQWLGWCGLRRKHGGEVDVGYRYAKRWWGRGFATEAARACVEHGFHALGLDRIIGLVQPANEASRRVLAKVGLRYEGRTLDGDEEVELWAIHRPPPTPG